MVRLLRQMIGSKLTGHSDASFLETAGKGMVKEVGQEKGSFGHDGFIQITEE